MVRPQGQFLVEKNSKLNCKNKRENLPYIVMKSSGDLRFESENDIE